MSAFQPILTCFLILVFVNIAVKGMAIVTQRRFMCTDEAIITSKSYMTSLLGEWRKEKEESTRLKINQSQVRQYFVFVLIIVLLQKDWIQKLNQIFIILAVLR